MASIMLLVYDGKAGENTLARARAEHVIVAGTSYRTEEDDF